MPTPTRGRRLGGSSAHQRHILANLATALFEHGKITTTEAKARRLRPYAERLITFAKRGDLHARREVLTVVTDRGVVHTLFTEIGPRFATRQGGYTRITKIGPRKGDNAPLAVIELVEEEATVAAPSRRRRPRRAQRPRRPGRRPPPRRRRLLPPTTRWLRTPRPRTPRPRTPRPRTPLHGRTPRTRVDTAEDAGDAAVRDAADEAGEAGDESGAGDEAAEDAAEGEPE